MRRSGKCDDDDPVQRRARRTSCHHAGGRAGGRAGGGWAIAACMMLAACSGGGGADYNRSDVPDREARAQVAIEQAAARSGTAATQRSGLPVVRAPRTAARDRAFPANFRGYWGVSDDDCELANIDAGGRINVDADTIRFHEMRARVQRLERRSPQEIVADLRFEGGGKVWERRTTFRLDAGGTQLVRSEPPMTQRYRRC